MTGPACLQKYGLVSTGWEELATWPFADFVFNQPSDWFQNCNKLKQAGFTGMMVDTDQVCQPSHKPCCWQEKRMPSGMRNRKLMVNPSFPLLKLLSRGNKRG